MHLSIPDTRECYIDENSKSGQFTAYNIFCNGVYHCSVRYSELFELNAKLQKEAKPGELGTFPGKTWLPLNESDIELRKIAIEVYLQRISDLPHILGGATFTTFMLQAQDEVKIACEEVELEVLLVNGKSITRTILTTDQTDEVLEEICTEIGLSPELTYYFSLVVVNTDEELDSGPEVVRTMQHFESPAISLERTACDTHRIQLRKGYWNPELDEQLLEDPVAANLLYVEAVQDIKTKLIEVPKESRDTFKALRQSGNKKGFVQECQKMKGYGLWQWKGLTSNWPQPESPVTVQIGSERIITVTADGEESVFHVTRIRCWKVGRVPDTAESEDRLELTFHYLIAKDQLEWITIQSEDAILMSMCLQAVVDELLRLKRGQAIKTPATREKRVKPREIRPRPVQVAKDESNSAALADMDDEALGTSSAAAAPAAKAGDDSGGGIISDILGGIFGTGKPKKTEEEKEDESAFAVTSVTSTAASASGTSGYAQASQLGVIGDEDL